MPHVYICVLSVLTQRQRQQTGCEVIVSIPPFSAVDLRIQQWKNC